MAQKIQLRRGTHAARTSVVLDVGEPAYTTDTKQVFVGDGVTAGGVPLGGTLTAYNESFVSVIPSSGDTPTDNATGFHSALVNAWTKTPYGSSLSPTNRYAVHLYPGFYDFSSIIGVSTLLPMNQSRYVDIVGIGSREDIVVKASDDLVYFSFQSGGCNVENITFKNILLFYKGVAPEKVSDVIVRDVNIYYGAGLPGIYFAQGATNNFLIDNCNISGGIYSSAGGGVNMTNSVIKNSRFLNSSAGSLQAFIGDVNYNNLFENCYFSSESQASIGHFYVDLDVQGLHETNVFKDCYFSGEYSFLDAAGATAHRATFENCHFQSDIYGAFQGSMSNCVIDAGNINRHAIEISQYSNTNTYPAFYNCKILAHNDQPAVTGVGASTGLFLNCQSNRPIATGVTGGNIAPVNYTIVSPRIK